MTFHLAIPAENLLSSRIFYEEVCGAKIGREYPTHFVCDFFGVQLVCHKVNKAPRQVGMYPRHFGVIVGSLHELTLMHDSFTNEKFGNVGVIWARLSVRHAGTPAEHHTFFVTDPSGNLIEFKWYADGAAVFG